MPNIKYNRLKRRLIKNSIQEQYQMIKINILNPIILYKEYLNISEK